MSKHRLDPRRYTGNPDEDLDDEDLDDEKPVIRKYRDGEQKSNKPHKEKYKITKGFLGKAIY